MKRSIYLETTIIGYLTSRPSRDLLTAANQQLTRDWWDEHRGHYDLYVSQAVVEECRAGDPEAAKERLGTIADIPSLNVTDNMYPATTDGGVGQCGVIRSLKKFGSGARSTPPGSTLI